MPAWSVMTVAAVIGFIAGAILLTLLRALHDYLLHPQMLSDGQYGMICCFTLPFGGAMGAVTGIALTAVWAASTPPQAGSAFTAARRSSFFPA